VAVNVKITNLPPAVTPTGTEVLALVQAGVTSKNAVNTLLSAPGGAGWVGNTPAGIIAATTVQGAINEIVSDLAASGGSSLVGFLQSGSGAVVRTAQSKMRDVVSVLDYGAPTDGTSDCYAAFVAAYAALPDTGGTIVFPLTDNNIWNFSQGLVLNKPVRIVGQLPTSSLFVVNTGTVLSFAADKTGITVNSYNSQGANPGGTPAGNWCEIAHLAIVSKGGPTGLLNGGTGAACDGILNRGPGTRVTNVWTNSFRRNGVRIVAAIGSGGATEGNANLWYLNDVHCNGNGSDGLYVDGADANAGLALKVNCSNNGGYGIVDSSFLGNTYIGCHTDGNTLGPIATDDPNAQSVFIGCYAETGEAALVSPTIMIGGLNSSSSRVSAASTAFVLGGSGACRAPFKYLNTKGTQTVGSAVGQNDNSLTCMTWGATSESATTDAWKLKFDTTYNVWAVEFANSFLFTPIRYPNSAGALYTAKGFTGPVMQNGYAVMNPGGAVSSAKVRLLGTAAPTSGTYEQGDIVYSSAPAAGGYIGWVCTTGGTPGTWKQFGAILP